MRILLGALAACCFLVAVCVQLAAMALYGDMAQAPSVPGLLPIGLGIAIAQPLADSHAPPGLRAAYARAILHRGDLAGAAAIVLTLPPSADRSEIEGTIAEGRGDLTTAANAYLAAR